MDGQKERQGDFVFSANTIGEYSFCFDNEMSTFAEKFVDFEIAVSAVCDFAWEQLTNSATRSRTSNEPSCLLSRAPPPSRPRSWRSLFSRSLDSSPPFPETRSTSELARTVTSPPSTALRPESSTSA
ncbi:putative membrane protein C17A5.08 [Ilyonectria robusta]